ncbi:MAG: hypothetical protein LBE53_05610 [Paucimonas sp.]|jgi:hypothetical protein|nr:hypothetical protein [Paucimonas sp.]
MAPKNNNLLQFFRELAPTLSRASRQRLSDEESNLLEHFRALPEKDRTAMRYLCSAIHQISTS